MTLEGEQLRDALNQHREENQLTYQELGERTGVAAGNLHRYLAIGGGINETTASKIRAYLNKGG